MGFVRSAKMQNCDIPVVIHPARCLTEMKQISATENGEFNEQESS